MALPLPNVLSNVGPGGPVVTGLGGINALTKSNLENMFYAPNIQSEIGYRNALTQGQNIENQYMPDKLRLLNAFQALQNQYYAPNILSEIGSRNALTNRTNLMTPLEVQEQQLKNQFYPDLTRAQIQSYQMGGRGGLGVGGKEQLFYQNLVARDNPQITDPNKIYEAANVLANGGTQLSDGTPLNPMSPAARASLDRIVKGTTTSPILTGNIKSNQAEAELGVLNDYAQQGLKPYGDTIMGYSPQQVMDTFKSDDESQKRLGRFIASQALQYEAAQNRIRLANGQPGVTASEELINLSGQMLKSKYPKLSYKARNEATRFLDEALKKGLEARQSVNIGASQSRGSGRNSSSNQSTDMSKMSDEQLRAIAGM